MSYSACSLTRLLRSATKQNGQTKSVKSRTITPMEAV